VKLGFEETQTPYTSGSQSARAWTERWVHDWTYCPNCGSPKINPFPNNSPVADFFCSSCKEEYELKSQKSIFGNKVLDGSYRTKCDRLAADNNPNLFLLNYDIEKLSVLNLFVVPKHFFVRCDSSPSRLDWFQHFAERNSAVRKNFHCTGWPARTKGICTLEMATDIVPPRSRARSPRVAHRSNEMRGRDWKT
jgi:hypothetical protein